MNGHFGNPGVGALQSTHDAELFWGGDESRMEILRLANGQFASTLLDDGNTPTTVIRKGLLIGKITSGGELAEWDADATNGTQDLRGVLGVELVMTDRFGTAGDRFAPLIVKAPLKASALKIEGSALVGHADEYLARQKLWQLGCRLDDDPAGYLSGMVERFLSKATNYTVVAADNGTTFYAITADATFTLPAIQPGLRFRFIRASDHEMVVVSPTADNMVVGNDLSADSVTFTTAGEQIGAIVQVESFYLSGTLKWLVTLPPAPFGTGTAALTYAIGT